MLYSEIFFRKKDQLTKSAKKKSKVQEFTNQYFFSVHPHAVDLIADGGRYKVWRNEFNSSYLS